MSVVFTCLILYVLLKKRIAYWSTLSFVNNKLFSKNALGYSIILLATSFFCTAWKIIPGLETEAFRFGLFKLQSYGFPNVASLLWTLSFKVAILAPMMVWFLTEKKWWKYALLSPILITTYQIRSIFFVTDIIDEYEIFQALPLLGLLTIVLIALSKNAKDQYLFKAIYNTAYTRAEKTVKNRFKKKQLELDKAKETLESYKEKSNAASLEELKALKERLEKKLSR